MSALFLTAFTHESAIGYVSGSRLCRTRLASLSAKATLPFSSDHSFLKSRRYSASNRCKLPLLLKGDFQLGEIEVLCVAEALKEKPVHDLGRDWFPLRMPRSVETSKMTAWVGIFSFIAFRRT